MNVDLKMEVQTRQNDVALLERQKDLMEKELKQAQVNSNPIIWYPYNLACTKQYFRVIVMTKEQK